jgi:hypothetical protein
MSCVRILAVLAPAVVIAACGVIPLWPREPQPQGGEPPASQDPRAGEPAPAGAPPAASASGEPFAPPDLLPPSELRPSPREAAAAHSPQAPIGTDPVALPRPPSGVRTMADVVRIAEQVAAAAPASAEVARNLALLRIAAGDFPGARTALEAVADAERDDWWRLLSAYTAHRLGELDRANAEVDAVRARWARADGIRFRTVSLCERVGGFGDFEPLPDNRVRPGDLILIYCDFENLVLTETKGEDGAMRYVLHLEYSWELRDRYGVLITVPAWETPQEQRMARMVYRRPIRDYHQWIRLPLPHNLGPGDYTVRLKVRDLAPEAQGAEDTRDVRIHVVAQ